jgi:hypothetical protein
VVIECLFEYHLARSLCTPVEFHFGARRRLRHSVHTLST